jgi:hypothetical protein
MKRSWSANKKLTNAFRSLPVSPPATFRRVWMRTSGQDLGEAGGANAVLPAASTLGRHHRHSHSNGRHSLSHISGILSDEELQKLAGKYRFTCSRAGTATISPRNCDHLTKDNHTLVPYVGSRFCRANYASELTKNFCRFGPLVKTFNASTASTTVNRPSYLLSLDFT